MKKLIIAAMLLAGLAGRALAFTETYDKGFSSFTVKGIVCTTGTTVNITADAQVSTWTVMSGYNLGGFRIQNQDSADSMWLGGQSVSTTTVSAAQKQYLGEKVAAGGNAVYAVSRDSYATSPGNVQIYCRAEDAAGVDGIIVSVALFGYK